MSDMNIEEKKKAILAARSKKKGLPPVVLMAVCAMLVIGAGLMFAQGRVKPTPAAGTSDVASPTLPETYSYQVSDFADGEAIFYELQAENLRIRYFIVKSSDGVIRAAFDACDACWPAGKGYYQDGDVMVCRNCNRKFPTASVNEVKGGCNPAPLERVERDGMIIIRADDILEGGRTYFDLPAKG